MTSAIRKLIVVLIVITVLIWLWSESYLNKGAHSIISIKGTSSFTVSAEKDEEILEKYKPNWKSLDSRPLPAWYDEAKIGIFIHWGVFSVPSFGSEWFWKYFNDGRKEYVNFMRNNYPPNFTYQDFARDFSAELFNPDDWAELFDAAGAKYVVLTSKHHEGFTNWPSKYSFSWNSMDVGPKRDLVGELANSIRNRTPHITFGLYHSLFEWFNPLYLEDEGMLFETDKFVVQKTMPELYELVNLYKPDLIWSDGDAGPDYYWKSKEFLAWLFNSSPVKDTVVVNDRWGFNISCHHGSFFTCSDRYNPGVIQPHKWENCFTLDKSSWGYNRLSKVSTYLKIEEVLSTIVETVSCGGNALVNVGPAHDGRIAPIMEERLRQMGSWLKINGEAVYKTKPWLHQNDTLTKGVWYTQSKENRNLVFAFVFQWPSKNYIVLGGVEQSENSSVTMIGHGKSLVIKQTKKGLKIEFPLKHEVKSDWIWVLKLKNISPN